MRKCDGKKDAHKNYNETWNKANKNTQSHIKLYCRPQKAT